MHPLDTPWMLQADTHQLQCMQVFIRQLRIVTLPYQAWRRITSAEYSFTVACQVWNLWVLVCDFQTQYRCTVWIMHITTFIYHGKSTTLIIHTLTASTGKRSTVLGWATQNLLILDFGATLTNHRHDTHNPCASLDKSWGRVILSSTKVHGFTTSLGSNHNYIDFTWRTSGVTSIGLLLMSRLRQMELPTHHI